jgi:phosphoribosylanthranilate isomerase
MGRTRIKICGITRIEDGLAAAQLGADAIGMVFYGKSPRNVTLDQARAIAGALPPFVTTVALFVDPTAAEVEAVIQAVRPDLLQFHGDETAEFCRGFERPYLKAVRVRPELDLLQYAARFAEARGLIPQNLPKPVVLAGGLEPGNVAQAVRAVRPWAVDVSSGVEASKGLKDAAKIAAFVNEIKEVDVQLSR